MPIEFEYLFNGLTAHEVESKLRHIVDCTLRYKYGDKPDELIVRRTEDEWAAMERSSVVLDVAALYELTVWLKENRYPYWMRAISGSSFILYLLDITTGNPLPPHRYCPRCKAVHWEPYFADGFDIPQGQNCATDGTLLLSDGHNIPWQTVWGYGDFQASFDIDLPVSLYEQFQEELALHWLQKLHLSRYSVDPYEGRVKCIKLSNLSLMFVLDTKTISADFYDREITAANSDDMLQLWKPLIQYPLEDDIGMPEPNCVADVVALSGLIHSTGTWDKITELMVDQMGYSLADMIAFRDDIYWYLVDHGFVEKDAWRGMNCVRKGLNLPVVTDEMQQARDKWVLSRCKKIEYLFPKAHAVEYLFFTLKSLF